MNPLSRASRVARRTQYGAICRTCTLYTEAPLYLWQLKRAGRWMGSMKDLDAGHSADSGLYPIGYDTGLIGHWSLSVTTRTFTTIAQ